MHVSYDRPMRAVRENERDLLQAGLRGLRHDLSEISDDLIGYGQGLHDETPEELCVTAQQLSLLSAKLNTLAAKMEVNMDLIASLNEQLSPSI